MSYFQKLRQTYMLIFTCLLLLDGVGGLLPSTLPEVLHADLLEVVDPEVVDPEVVDALWDGEDVPSSLGTELLGGPQIHPSDWMLFGPFVSGTNLLLKTLSMNWPLEIKSHCGWDNGPLQHCGVWKHTNGGAENIYDIFSRRGGTANFSAIISVRSPFAQLRSWRKAPYDLNPCLRHPLNISCEAYVSVDEDLWQDHLHPVAFDSTVDIYNRYMREYKQLADDQRFKQVLFVPYEDMVENPDQVLRHLEDHLQLPARTEYRYLDIPSKDHGRPSGRTEALRKLSTRDYLTVFSP